MLLAVRSDCARHLSLLKHQNIEESHPGYCHEHWRAGPSGARSCAQSCWFAFFSESLLAVPIATDAMVALSGAQ